MGTTRRSATGGVLAVAALSAVLAWLIQTAFTGEETPFTSALWAIYLPTWFIVNALFGGIHGAPAWSLFPSIFIAVFIENAIVWFGIKWLVRKASGKRVA